MGLSSSKTDQLYFNSTGFGDIRHIAQGRFGDIIFSDIHHFLAINNDFWRLSRLGSYQTQAHQAGICQTQCASTAAVAEPKAVEENFCLREVGAMEKCKISLFCGFKKRHQIAKILGNAGGVP